MDKITKEKIDSMSYIDMLTLNRYAPVGHPYFKTGTEIASYFEKKFRERREGMSHAQLVAASKTVGWEGKGR